MPSNSLSKRRDLLRRPIVCRKGPPPTITPPPPPPDVACSLQPEFGSTFPGGTIGILYLACNGDLPIGSNVVAIYSATGGTLTGPNPYTNCLTEPGLWQSPPIPGFYTLKAVFQWPDTAICVATAIVQVVGM